MHFCLGANLARVEASALIAEVSTRMKNGFGRACRADDINVIKRIHSMPVRFTPGCPVGAQ